MRTEVEAVLAAAMLLRRIRADAAILLLLVTIVGATSFLFASAPRVLNRVTDDAIRFAVTSASPVDRHIRLNATGTIGPGGEGGVSAVRAYGEERERDLPASIHRILSDRFLGVTSVRLAVERSIVAVSLRHQDGVSDATKLVSGRWPVDRGMPLHQIEVGQQPPSTDGDGPVVFEAALSSEAADTTDVQVGDRLRVFLDGSDRLLPRSAFSITPTEIEIVGVFEPLDPDADEWVGSGLLEPTFKHGPSGIEAIYATAYVAAESYPNLYAGRVPFRYDWHFQVDPGRLDAGQAETLQTDLRRLELIASTEDNGSVPGSSSVVALANVSFGSGLLGIIDRFAAQQARSTSILSIAGLGPICLAGAAIAMLAVLLVHRRRSSLLLARGRGASGRLLLGAALGEAVLLTGSSSLVGLLLSVVLVPARDAPLSLILAFGVAGAATFLLVAAVWPAARRPLLQLERDDAPVLRAPARRLVIEATIVGIAVVALVLLRQRGLTLGQAGGDLSSDPLLAAVPMLSGLAAGIVALRLYPLAIRALGWLAARRRDFVPVLGLRTVARHPAIANLPLLVLMLTAAFGAFASVIASSIERGQIAASYREVGADYRLEGIGIGGLPASLDPTAVAGVEAVASGIVDPRAVFVGAGGERATIELDALDAGAYRTVTAGTAADTEWPNAFLAPPFAGGIGTDANPIPAIVSAEFPPDRTELGTGATFTVELARQPMTLRVVQRRAGLPGLGSAANFAIVPLDWIKAAAPGPLAPTVMWLRASSDAAGPLATMADGASTDIRVVSRQDAYAEVHDAPLGTAVADGFGLALGVAVLYLAITLVGAVILSAAGRTRDLAYLRTLGVSTRQALALTAVEHAPPALVALLPGVLLGVAVATLAEPGLGLAHFTGGHAVPLSVDWAQLGLMIVALFAVVVVAIAAGTWLSARARPASALRIEDS